MNNDDNSFRIDRKARSFQLSDFPLRTLPGKLPYLALAFALLALFGLLFGWLPTAFLPEKWKLVPVAALTGFLLGSSLRNHSPAVKSESAADHPGNAQSPTRGDVEKPKSSKDTGTAR